MTDDNYEPSADEFAEMYEREREFREENGLRDDADYEAYCADLADDWHEEQLKEERKYQRRVGRIWRNALNRKLPRPALPACRPQLQGRAPRLVIRRRRITSGSRGDPPPPPEADLARRPPLGGSA